MVRWGLGRREAGGGARVGCILATRLWVVQYLLYPRVLYGTLRRAVQYDGQGDRNAGLVGE